MADPILNIRTTMPPVNSCLVLRPRLIQLLEHNLTTPQGFVRRLTLVSAPAGFGKTTLVQNWLAGQENVAWFTIDEGDNVFLRFWTYVISALQNVKKDLGAASMAMLYSESISSESGLKLPLIPLLNELVKLEFPAYLVLDDYHLVTDDNVDQSLRFFIENLPAALHVVVISRIDPPWPLALWQARQEMAEIKQETFKFSLAETKMLFKKASNFELSTHQLRRVHQKTEGWVTALHLFIQSLPGKGNTNEYVNYFVEDHRQALSFLSEEVFSRLEPTVQDFLLTTSVLSQLNPHLCDAITGRTDSLEIIRRLNKANLFIIPLDEGGNWFRYHTLFSDLLFQELKARQPELINELYLRASTWFLQADQPGEAIRYAFLADSPDSAAKILDQKIDELWQKEGMKQVSVWLDQLPEAIKEIYPRFWICQALFHLINSGKEEARNCLRTAVGLSGRDQGNQQEFVGLLAVVQAYFSIFENELVRASDYALRALELLPPDKFFWRISAAIYAGDARTLSGDLENAHTVYMSAYRESKKYDSAAVTLTVGLKAANNLWAWGKLKQARELVAHLLQHIDDHGLAGFPRAGIAWALWAALVREQGDLQAAERHLELGLAISEPERPALGFNYLFQIIISLSRAQYQKALNAINQIELIDYEVGLPAFVTIPAAIWKARILLETEDYAIAREVLDKHGFSEQASVKKGQEAGSLVLARALLAEKEFKPARKILDQVQKLNSSGTRTGLLVETMMIKSRLEEHAGHHRAAEQCLEKALHAGRIEGYMQTFLDEAKDLKPIYARVLARATRSQKKQGLGIYLKEILGRFEDVARPTTVEGLIEDLSARELEVLTLIGQGYSNQTIGKKLFLTEGTVKWHTSNIYGKLGVKSRTQAVARAQSLKLLST